MPKAPMTQEEIDSFKERILDSALHCIISEGFNNLSMRKIASRLDISATTIYNYYANKDELNLNIRIRGFELLFRMLKENRDRHRDFMDRIKAMIRAYADFGINFSNYYDIMFNLHTPKYLDYVGTDIEPTALHEKQTALKCLTIFMDEVSGYLTEQPKRHREKYDDRIILYYLIRLWSDLHGFITLHNSRVLHEVIEAVDEVLEWRIENLMASIQTLRDRIDTGEAI
jgi:AcrR family transcriptional regulator